LSAQNIFFLGAYVFISQETGLYNLAVTCGLRQTDITVVDDNLTK